LAVEGSDKMIIEEIVKELLNTASFTGIKLSVMEKEFSRNFINNVLEKFKPSNITNHLSVGENCYTLPCEDYEFSYSESLKSEPGYLFFEQTGKGFECLLKIDEIRETGKLFYNSFGIEYFLVNENMDYLISVNWYTVQIQKYE
jgi:hypothetical protein